MIMETGIAVPNVKLIGGSEAAQSHLCRRCGCLRSSMFVDMASVPSHRGILRHAKSLAPSPHVKMYNPAEIRGRPGYGVDLRPVWRLQKIWHHRVMFTRRAVDDEDLELQQVQVEARESLDSQQGTRTLSIANPSGIDIDRGVSRFGGREYGQGEDLCGIIGSASNSNIPSAVAMASKASVTSGNETGLTPRRRLESGNVKLASQKFPSSVLHFSSTTVAAHSPMPKKLAMSRTDQAFLCLGFIAVVLSGSISALLLMAIPTLRAMKKAAESVEKLADTAREELPGTMAALRLSGMEISDLTMELSDLSQDIGEGLRSSARAVQAAEDGLRRMGSFASNSTLNSRNSTGGGSEASSSRSRSDNAASY
eukprot:TRINITY_DN4420_c0_g1_i2.p1 TRINITY_DN4420_c0_g1~~TRINITY_DN4420_c0_g1_i2.p1  ORF type:complete len:367 (-),score=54.39 TRINITY_DN4420_c0_g1_i2:829-1929(-)